MTLYLSLEQLIAIHAAQLSRYGGGAGVRDRAGLESAVARPQASFGGEDLYPDLQAKAAALAHSLVANHPFVDGNKRTGAHAMLQFLRANAVRHAISPADLVGVTLGVARGEIGAEALAIWLRQRSLPAAD
jgi:death-on-curing protein